MSYFTGSLVNGFVNSFKLIFDILFYCHFISAYCIHKISSTPKMVIPYLYFKFAYLSNTIKLFFLFKYPIKLDILKYGEISTSICIGFEQLSAYTIFTHLLSQSALNILPIFLIYYLSVIFRCKHNMIFPYPFGMR